MNKATAESLAKYINVDPHGTFHRASVESNPHTGACSVRFFETCDGTEHILDDEDTAREMME